MGVRTHLLGFKGPVGLVGAFRIVNIASIHGLLRKGIDAPANPGSPLPHPHEGGSLASHGPA